MKRFLTFALVLASAMAVRAAYPKHISVDTPEGRTVTVTAVDDNILRVSSTPKGTPAHIGGASVLTSEDGERLNANGAGMRANLCGIEVEVTSKGQVTINAGKGKTVTDSGVRPVADGKQEIVLTVDARGSFYGAGERGHRLNLRGDTLHMYNRQNYGYTDRDPRIRQMGITMPLFLSTDGYAIVFDDYAPADMILGNPIKYITENKKPVSWYFVNGAKSLAEVTTALTHLTGRQNLPPLWTLGYITSKYGYHNAEEAEGAIDTLKTAGYPVDGIILDLYWYGKEQDMGRLAWEPKQWPDHPEMLSYLKQRGVNLIAISQPYVLRNGKGIDNYNELSAKGLLLKDSIGSGPQEVKIWVGEGGMFDMSNPETQKWLSNRYLQLSKDGIASWWGDLGEPEVHPENAVHANGLTAREYHNKYGNDWSAILSKMYARQFPDERKISMMRGGTTGLQRYDVFPWSTDVSRSWGGLQPQIKIMLGSGLSGLGYMGHDVGGFAVDPANPIDPELYVRWLQLGLFSPMLRTHAQFNAEPYHYPEHQATTLDIIRQRYAWLPYNYTLAWENATKGWPLVRPLNFHSDDATENYDDITDEFLWGRDVLVAPVITQGATSRDIVLPSGSQWVDIANPTKYYAGGTTIKNYPAPLEVLPLFVRAGAFIPSSPLKMANTRAYNPNKLTVNFYPAKDAVSQYTMFEDDMTRPSAATGNQGRLVTFTGDTTGKMLTVTCEAEGTYPGAKAEKTVTLIINNQKEEPRAVEANKHNVRYTYDKKAATVTVTLLWKMAKPMQVVIRH